MADFRAVVIVDSNRGGASHSLHKTFSTNPDVELAALADPVDEGRERFTGESGAATGYADYREMLQHERPDIAVIAQHWYDEERVETFLAVVESGVKGIMLEKPAAAWPEQADRMLAAVEAANIPVVMAHRSRENPAMREIKRRGQSGEWGPLIQLKAHGKGDHRAGTTDTLILGTHELDAMIFITGEPPATCWGSVLVEGRPASRADAQPSPNYGIGQVAGDRLFAEYVFPSGVIGTYESLPVGDGAHGSEWLGLDLYYQNALITTRARPGAQIHMFSAGGVFAQDYMGEWSALCADGWTPDASDPAASAWSDWAGDPTVTSNRVIGEELVRCIREQRRPVYASGIHDAAITLQMIVGPQRSHLEGKRLEIPLAERGNPWVG